MASTNPATASVPSPAPAINPLLLASACSGYLRGLNILLNSQGASGDEELPFDLQAAYASSSSVQLTPESLLDGVTIEGDTALHAVASNGDSDDFLRSANLICSNAGHLLFVQNKRGDTPLHLAARAGRYNMVSHLVDLANEIVVGVSRPTTTIDVPARLKRLLETKNRLEETALHEAIRVGSDDTVRLLMEEDPELATIPKKGTSPLYLAVSLGNKTIAEMLYRRSGGVLSYSGPNGQNALHAAVRRGPDLTNILLEWNNDLTTQGDENGSTPLHFAAGLHTCRRTPLHLFLAGLIKRLLTTERSENDSRPLDLLWPTTVCWLVLEANSGALYQPDHDGSFPIHVAAFVGASRTVSVFLDKFPSSAGLRDAKGRTFLHVAVEESNVNIIRHACRNQLLSWILNMRDNDGNTALHLAVQKGSLRVFCALLMNLQVELNLTNDKGHTPLDISWYKMPKGFCYGPNSEVLIWHALTDLRAKGGASRGDHFNKHNVYQLESGDETSVSERIKDVTRNMNIGSVLIATVTFGANFAPPGGYRADDHVNGGTPTMAGRYASDAFMMANTLSFVCSSIATTGFMYSGTSMVNLSSRTSYLITSAYFMGTSISSLALAFALGAYIVLAPVAYRTAIAICVLASLGALHNDMEYLLKSSLLVRPYTGRNGLIWTFYFYAREIVLFTLKGYWPIILSFGWAAYARN